MIRVFIGYDRNEVTAYNVFAHSIIERSTEPVSIAPLKVEQLKKLHNRDRHPFQSTEFSFTRFLVPYLCGYEGWAIFADCDFLCLSDIAELWNLRDERYAIQVCQHDYTPQESEKFLGQHQTKYQRKNWSSLILFNNAKCGHLTPEYVNKASGLELHQFKWLDDGEIGSLPLEWNWLVGVYPKTDKAKMVHYTIGGPYFEEYHNCDYAYEWNFQHYRANYCAKTANIRATG